MQYKLTTPCTAEELAKLVCREADAHAEVSVEGEAAAAETADE